MNGLSLVKENVRRSTKERVYESIERVSERERERERERGRNHISFISAVACPTINDIVPNQVISSVCVSSVRCVDWRRRAFDSRFSFFLTHNTRRGFLLPGRHHLPFENNAKLRNERIKHEETRPGVNKAISVQSTAIFLPNLTRAMFLLRPINFALSSEETF